MGLARVQRRALGLRVLGLLQQPADPRGVRGAGDHGVHADPLGHPVRGHREGQRLHRALGRRVQRPLGQPQHRGDRGRVHHDRRLRAAQVGEGRAGHAGHRDDVDVQHARPLGVVVGVDLALGADAGVVDDDVEAAELLRGPVHRRRHRGGVGDVDLDPQGALRRAGGVEVQGRGRRAAGLERADRRRADPGTAAGDEGLQAGELGGDGVSHGMFSSSSGVCGRSHPRALGPGKARLITARRRAEGVEGALDGSPHWSEVRRRRPYQYWISGFADSDRRAARNRTPPQ